tara:strand:- start:250 stop:606 length:357 start_codon:yes stop_codon:yes gene_type:complete
MNKIVDKSWGYEETIAHTDKYLMKKLFIKAGHRLSKRFYVKRDETIYVSKGLLLLDLSDAPNDCNILKLEEGKSWRIMPRTIHRFRAPDNQSVELFEISTPEIDDIVQLTNDCGREDA